MARRGMGHHLVCLSIDTDPDGLNGPAARRSGLVWDGLEYLIARVGDALGPLGRPPLTWFVRADGQLRDEFGNAAHLFERHSDFWEEAGRGGDEIGWHPHLYREGAGGEPELITESAAACEELESLHQELCASGLTFRSFRNGEAWHSVETLNTVERLGIACDSTAIPGRVDAPPRNWEGAPNRPYFPAAGDVRRQGASRPLVEIPMTTWSFQASYDSQPKLRYMNPAAREAWFASGLDDWEKSLGEGEALQVWTLIFHPDEVMPRDEEDILYANSLDTLVANVGAFRERIERRGAACEFVTVAEAADRWRSEAVR